MPQHATVGGTMARFFTGGAMAIVAHQDDDILFMTPDIVRDIDAGLPVSTVYVTAGDAGAGRAYWEGREDGARAAYSEMTGASDWTHETVRIDVGEQAFEITSSFLEDAPQVRLYFLRLPDGGGVLEPEDWQQLARLEDGSLARVTSQDGAHSYTRSDLVGVLKGIIDLQAPGEIRLQLADGVAAVSDHTDHIHTTQFALEALAASSVPAEVTEYVSYFSAQLPANLAPADAARNLEIMQAYAAFDPSTLAEDGTLLPAYATWTARSYTADDPLVAGSDAAEDDGAGEAPDLPPEADAPAPDGVSYSLGGPDMRYFEIDPQTGGIVPRDWFDPPAGDAWDQNADHLYELTRIARFGDGRPSLSEDILYDARGQDAPAPADEETPEPQPDPQPGPAAPDPVAPPAAPADVITVLDLFDLGLDAGWARYGTAGEGPAGPQDADPPGNPGADGQGDGQPEAPGASALMAALQSHDARMQDGWMGYAADEDEDLVMDAAI